MNETNKTALIIAFIIVLVLLLLFGGGTMTGATLSGGMMLDVDSYFTHGRSRCAARLGHFRAKEVTALRCWCSGG
jgi:uncharacterized membrane protein